MNKKWNDQKKCPLFLAVMIGHVGTEKYDREKIYCIESECARWNKNPRFSKNSTTRGWCADSVVTQNYQE